MRRIRLIAGPVAVLTLAGCGAATATPTSKPVAVASPTDAPTVYPTASPAAIPIPPTTAATAAPPPPASAPAFDFELQYQNDNGVLKDSGLPTRERMTIAGIIAFAANELRATQPRINEVDAICRPDTIGSYSACSNQVLLYQDGGVNLVANGKITPVP